MSRYYRLLRYNPGLTATTTNYNSYHAFTGFEKQLIAALITSPVHSLSRDCLEVYLILCYYVIFPLLTVGLAIVVTQTSCIHSSVQRISQLSV